MRIYRHIGDVPDTSERAVAYGSFEGVHLGHRGVLRETVRRFERSCVVVDERSIEFPRLSSRRKVLAWCHAAGADEVLLVPRDSGAVATILRQLGAIAVVAGGGEAIPPALRTTNGLLEMAPVTLGGEVVCSSWLRRAVVAGDMDTAGAISLHPYSVDGRVIHGFHRGASIGVPTANLRVRDLLLPPDGVYAVCVQHELQGWGRWGGGVANLGRNPTFGNNERSLETNIFDFSGDLYGRCLEVGFVRRLRGEKKFESIDELVTQIRRDIEAAREIQREHE